MRSICPVLALGLAMVGLCAGQSALKTTEWGFDKDVRLVDEERGFLTVLRKKCSKPNSVSIANLQGIPETWGFEGFITADNFTVSPWHNVPLIAGTGLHSFIVEMPKDSSAKFEVQTVRMHGGVPLAVCARDALSRVECSAHCQTFLPNPIPCLGGAAQPHQAGPHRCRGAAVLPLKPHLELRPAAPDLGGSGLCQPRSQRHGRSKGCAIL